MNKVPEDTQIVRAVFIAPLSMVPVVWFGGFGIHLYNLLTIPNYQIHSNIYLSGLIISAYMVFIAGVITLIYGLPVYVLLKRYNRATLLNLAIAGGIPFIILGLVLSKSLFDGLPWALFGVLVAATFWLIATVHRPAVTDWLKKGGVILLGLMLILWVVVLIAEALLT